MGKRYVCGFLISEDRRHVVLIEKLWPEWMKGKLNGVGGSVEEDEEPHMAMRREFLEETGADVDDWRLFCVNNHGPNVIYFYVKLGNFNVTTAEREAVGRYEISAVLRPAHNPPIMDNLTWLLPLAVCPNGEFATVYDPTPIQAKGG